MFPKNRQAAPRGATKPATEEKSAAPSPARTQSGFAPPMGSTHRVPSGRFPSQTAEDRATPTSPNIRIAWDDEERETLVYERLEDVEDVTGELDELAVYADDETPEGEDESSCQTVPIDLDLVRTLLATSEQSRADSHEPRSASASLTSQRDTSHETLQAKADQARVESRVEPEIANAAGAPPTRFVHQRRASL